MAGHASSPERERRGEIRAGAGGVAGCGAVGGDGLGAASCWISRMGLLPLLPVACAAASLRKERKEQREKKRRNGRGREKEKEIKKNGNILQIWNFFRRKI
jgi:hypothetical protein